MYVFSLFTFTESSDAVEDLQLSADIVPPISKVDMPTGDKLRPDFHGSNGLPYDKNARDALTTGFTKMG